MKNKLIYVVMILCTFGILSGCNKSYNPTIGIYELRRASFDSFVANPDVDILSKITPKIYKSTVDTQRYYRQGILPFDITSSFIEFANNKIEIQNFLAQNGIHFDVDTVAIIDAPKMPMTIWAKSNEESAFITVNEQTDDESYAYRCYTQYAFNKKFAGIYGSLNANSKNIPGEATVKLYSDYADVPLIATLEAFGASINKEDRDQITITFNEGHYCLDLTQRTLYRSEYRTENLLYLIDGVPVFVYSTEQDLMVDTATLSAILREMGQSISVTLDRESCTVTIK